MAELATVENTLNEPIDAGGRGTIKSALAKIAKKQEPVKTFNDYYYGNHPFNFSSEKFTTKFAGRLKKFRNNLCPTVVKAPADRLEVIGFATDTKSDIYNTSWEKWLYSQMPRFSKRIHRDAFRTGDAYVVVWTDEDDRSRIYHQDPRNCCVFYDAETGEVESGAKLWRGNDNHIYLTLYFRDRIEKYVTRNAQSAGNVPTTAAAFVKRSEAGESWPLENPTDVCPIFHFGLEASILTDVIPLNDALNKTIADLLVSSEANSLRQRWSAGVAYETNPETGKQIIPFEQTAQWVASNDAAAKFGQFPDVSLADFLKAAEYFRNQVAAVAGIPIYYFDLEGGGNIPSGEALRKAESRFVATISDAQLDFGETWARVMALALDIDGKKPEDSKIETRWKPADAMSANELVDLGIKKVQVGVSKEKVLSEIGYSDDEITKMRTENQAAASDAVDAFSKTFNAGPNLIG